MCNIFTYMDYIMEWRGQAMPQAQKERSSAQQLKSAQTKGAGGKPPPHDTMKIYYYDSTDLAMTSVPSLHTAQLGALLAELH